MNKWLAGMLLSVSGVMLTGATDFRMDLLTKDTANGLVFKGGSAGVSGEKAAWLKDKAETRLLIWGEAPSEWQEKSFQFMPKADGVISLQLLANPAGKMRPFVAYDNLRVEGAQLVNGGFEQYQPPCPAGWWNMGKDSKIVGENAPEGKNYAEVSHDDRYVQEIRCKGGQLVKVTFLVRNAVRETEVK